MRSKPGELAGSSRSLVRRHPRLLLAVKTAFAAALAWLLVLPLGGFTNDYPYYAPLGAIVAMATTVVSSLRTSIQTVSAILVGAALALAARALPLPDVTSAAVAITVVIALGVLLAGWPFLGEMGSWVPIAGLFVLILGGSDPWTYVLAYGGLTAVGALVGIVVNLLLPQLPLTPADRAQDQLRASLAEQLEALARDLRSEEMVTEEHWERFADELNPRLRHADELVTQALEARRANWRASRWTERSDRQHRRARGLQRLTATVEEVVALVTDPMNPLHAYDDDAARLRAAISHALARIAELLRVEDEEPEVTHRATYEQAAAAVRQLERVVTVHARRPTSDETSLAAAAVAVGLERAVAAWR